MAKDPTTFNSSSVTVPCAESLEKSETDTMDQGVLYIGGVKKLTSLMQWNCLLFVCRKEKYEVLTHQSKMPFQDGCIEQLGLATNCGESARDK